MERIVTERNFDRGTMLTDHIRFNRIYFRNQAFTGDYLASAVDACSRYLDSNIRSNSPIVYLFAPNHLKTVIAFLAIVKSGRTCLLVDPVIGALEYEEMLADSPPAAVIKIDPVTLEFDFGKEITVTDYRMDHAPAAELDEVGVMLYTAADDGYPKAAMLTHENLLSNAKAMYEDIHVREDSTTCVLLPFHHLFGLQNGIISPLAGGGSLLICDISDVQKVSGMVNAMLHFRATHIYSVPLVHYLLSKSSHIQEIGRPPNMIISGGYKLPEALRDRFERKLSIPIYEGYGLTEASPGCISQSQWKPFDPGSIGSALLNYQIKIADESGMPVAAGTKGEICVKGDNVMKGYFNHPAATKKAIVDGWLHTGDWGKGDENGNIYFLGLKKKMFNVGGNKVYPEDIRRLMLRHSNVESVELWSDYDAMSGDRIKADVKLKNFSESVGTMFSQWCISAIGTHKTPQKISIT